jgi:UDP-N-acetylglucosamine 1-carboxyvinyltransferase
MGPLFARLGWVKIAKPGGCAIGDRPIDLHLRNLERLGAVIEERHGYITARCLRLTGQEISLDFPSVGATENLMMAASLAKGKTIIYNAAREPEIVDIQNFLNQMGAKVYGAGTSVIVVEGIDADHLGSTEYTVIPDRIEAGTYLLAAAVTRGSITLENVIPQHIQALLSKLVETNARLSIGLNKITLESGRTIQPANIITLPYPGFATDLQPQFMSLVTLAEGSSVIKETVYSRRFGHVEELRRMGANIQLDTNSAIVRGVKQLTGASVRAVDLRAGAALVIAGLAAHGITKVSGVEHIMRGYEKLVEKLQGVGAKIELITEEGN